MAEGLGNDVNMMPGFMVTGISCFGMPYGAVSAGWVEIPKASDEWLEIRPVKARINNAEVKNAT